MNDIFYLGDEQFEKIKRYFPYPNGVPRVDDRRVISGIIYVLKHGLKWSHAPKEYGPHKTLYNHFIRWSKKGRVQQNILCLGERGWNPRTGDDRCHTS
jgi:transposase